MNPGGLDKHKEGCKCPPCVFRKTRAAQPPLEIFSVRLTDEVIDRLRASARAEGISLAELIERLIMKYP